MTLNERLVYKRIWFSSCLVSVSSGVDSYFRWLPKSKRKVIFNPLVETKVDTRDDLLVKPSIIRLLAWGALFGKKALIF